MLQLQDRLNFLICVKNDLSTNLCKELYPEYSQPLAIYGLAKICKPIGNNNFPKFRDLYILSTVNITEKLL